MIISISRATTIKEQLIAEGVRCGITFSTIEKTNILKATINSHSEYFILEYTSVIPYSVGLVLSNKNFIHQLLRTHKIPITKGSVFPLTDEYRALAYAQTLGWPIMMRQESVIRPDKAEINIRSIQKAKIAFRKIKTYGECILVEKYVSGVVYRVCTTASGYWNVCALHTSSKKWKDVTTTVDPSFKKLADRMRKIFAKTSCFSFELRVFGSHMLLTKQTFVVTDVFPSVGINAMYPLYKGSKTFHFARVLIHMIFPETT